MHRGLQIAGASLRVALLCAATLFTVGFFQTHAAEKSSANPQVRDTNQQLKEIAAAIQTYRATFARWPENLRDLKQNNAGIPIYSGSLTDAWGRKLQYEKPGFNG